KDDEWLNIPIKRRSKLMEKRKVKISASTQIYESVYKAPGGLLRIFMEIVDNKITDIIVSGDFSANPMNATEILENALLKQNLDLEELKTTLTKTYSENALDIPGVTPEDFVKAIELSVKDLF
ncbi:MAG: lipoate protein ligase C-terminal domain-containing protein, partial [Candidatus Heimdallarchaeota archaeon]